MSQTQPTASWKDPQSPGLSKGLIWIMAIGAGASVANLYYNQPLLADIAQTFQISSGRTGNIPMLTQIGYALGMFLFVPLGDLRERKQLTTRLLGAVVLALLGMAFAQNVTMLEFTSLAVGATTVVPQIIVPFAAQLAAPKEQGRVVGLVMSGLFFGILLARTVSGVIGNLFGWRMMFLIAAGMMLTLALILRIYLPESVPENPHFTYPQLIRSLGVLIKEQPVLREASLMGGLLFAAFSVFWTTLVFFLKQPPYHYGSEVAGVFGLVGVVGASIAPVAGRLSDRKSPRRVAGAAAVITFLAFMIFWVFGQQLWGLILGVILLDLGVQSAQIANQTRIFSLRAEARNRLNTVYMVTYFIGGAIGSSLGAYAWSAWQWNGVCWLGLGLVLLSLLAWRFKGKSFKN